VPERDMNISCPHSCKFMYIALSFSAVTVCFGVMMQSNLVCCMWNALNTYRGLPWYDDA